jgi:hypothetical protein
MRDIKRDWNDFHPRITAGRAARPARVGLPANFLTREEGQHERATWHTGGPLTRGRGHVAIYDLIDSHPPAADTGTDRYYTIRPAIGKHSRRSAPEMSSATCVW